MPRRIMIIRHAEKPDGRNAGVSINGDQDDEDLIVRGWQRTGALVKFFAAPDDHRITSPRFLFASGSGPHSKSLRPQHTISALGERLQLHPNVGHLKGDEQALSDDARTKNGAALIAWQHEAIPEIVNLIVGNTTTCPQRWPGERFDIVWVLDELTPGNWSFNQVPQMLLPGDSNAVILA